MEENTDEKKRFMKYLPVAIEFIVAIFLATSLTNTQVISTIVDVWMKYTAMAVGAVFIVHLILVIRWDKEFNPLVKRNIFKALLIMFGIAMSTFVWTNFEVKWMQYVSLVLSIWFLAFLHGLIKRYSK